MRILKAASREWQRYLGGLPRAARPRRDVERSVARILRQVRLGGDEALARLTERLDGVRVSPASLRMPAGEVRALARQARPEVVSALRRMARSIEAYHRRQLDTGFEMRLADGSVLAEIVRPLDSVGLYVPGGAGAYPSSVLMNAIPARVAGVKRVVVATPPRALASSPSVAAALRLVGLEGCVFRVGGAQAVAALAYGTPSLPPVAKIVGPGNSYVAEAKRQVRGVVEIDHEAGPSEVVVLADGSADPAWVAADLLAQAEHGSGLETVLLVTPSERLASEVRRLVREGVGAVANVVAARRALRRNGAIVLVAGMAEAVATVNSVAPEHAQVMTRDAESVAGRLVAGAVFVGPYSPVAVGDYGIGPNHVLPTGGAARHPSPLSVRDFQRRQSCVRMTRSGLRRAAGMVVSVARAEGFRGHAQSILARFP